MKNSFWLNKVIVGIFFSVLMATLEAGSPIWTFTALDETTILVPPGNIRTIRYIITNQSNKPHTLVMKPIAAGISQITAGMGVCGNPFRLEGRQSCTLTLEVRGDALKENIRRGPIVCERSSELQCFQPTEANNLNITRTPPPLSSSVSALGLSVNNTATNVALTGNPRIITISNNGVETSKNVAYVATPALPAGTNITPATCGDIPVGGTCILTVTPGAQSTAVPQATPAPVTLTIGGLNTNPVVVTLHVLTIGSFYQSGYIFAIDDTTPNTGSVGGKALSASDQASAGTIHWASNGLAAWYDLHYFAEVTEIAVGPPCVGKDDGACNTDVIVSYYNANRAAGGPPPTPLSYYAAGLCRQPIDGYTDWYLPAICEMGPAVFCTPGTPNITNNLPFLVSNGGPCPLGHSCLTDLYWSSTKYSPMHIPGSWVSNFIAYHGGANGYTPRAARCVRALT